MNLEEAVVLQHRILDVVPVFFVRSFQSASFSLHSNESKHSKVSGRNFNMRTFSARARWNLSESRFVRIKVCLKTFTLIKHIVLLVNVAGFNASLNWTNSCEWLNVLTNPGHLFIHVSEQRNAQEEKLVHETTLDRENTRLYRYGQRNVNNQLCVVTAGRLIIGKFYNSVPYIGLTLVQFEPTGIKDISCV
jgi:hypothetical protein